MAAPRLTFFCELDAPALVALFRDERLRADLHALRATVSLALRDLSPQRAAVVRSLNREGISLVAWLLLPLDQGYFVNLLSAPEAVAQYETFRRWSREQGLRWAGVGLDVEPPIDELVGVSRAPLPVLLTWLRRALGGSHLRAGRERYQELVARVKADGYLVETYQFPLIADERRAGSSVLQRMGLVLDLPVDREVWMLYSSTVPGGPTAIASYGPEAQAIGLGSLGGGVALTPQLTWEELARDLRLAHRWTDRLYIYSLEGCARQGYLSRLREFDWSEPASLPGPPARAVNLLRAGLRAGLWTTVHPAVLLAAPAAIATWWLKRRAFALRR
ncbi:MAG: hypothetical protein ACYC1C_18935 [Chloroflexota bacterium]